MPRSPRFDQPGRWFHVVNRGIARRAVFENDNDVRHFLSRAARSVRRGELEVHAFCVMATHFHLLVRSPSAQLSEAMRRIQNEYVRYFNRTRRRDGPLFRGRFLSKPVLSVIYRRILVRYIDHNPVKARIVKRPWLYPHGSAWRFASGKVPRWLSSDWILGTSSPEPSPGSGTDYVGIWGRSPSGAEWDLVEQRLRGRTPTEDPLDDLVGAASPRVRDWMVRKARLADGTRPGVACVPARTVQCVTDDLRHAGRRLIHRTSGGQWRDAWGIALAGLLRQLAGLKQRETAERLGVSTSMVARRLRTHERLCRTPEYATRLGRVAVLCIRAAFPDAREKVRNRS